MSGVEIEFADCSGVSFCIGKAAGAAFQVDSVIGYSEKTRTNIGAVQCCLVKHQYLAIIGDPVVSTVMVVKSELALTILTPKAPLRSPVATPNVVPKPSISPKPPRSVKIAPPMSEQVEVLAKPLGVDSASMQTPSRKQNTV